MTTERKRYLGDGAYAEFTGDEVILTTSDGIRDTNRIVLGATEWWALLAFSEALFSEKTERSDGHKAD